jgi:hypothetical protein
MSQASRQTAGTSHKTAPHDSEEQDIRTVTKAVQIAESALEYCKVQASRMELISTIPVDTARAQPGNGVTGPVDQKLLARCTVCRNYAIAD